MTQEASKLFMKRAKERGLDISRGVYGEWLNYETRLCWYFWYQAWRDRAKNLKRKKAEQDKAFAERAYGAEIVP